MRALEMARLGRHIEPIVVPPVHVPDGSVYQLGGGEIIQRREGYGDVVAADLLDVTVRVDPYAALLAEHMVIVATFAKSVLTCVLFAGQQPEFFGFDADAPVARLPTIAAVALARPRGKIEIGFESDFSAVAAALVCPFSHDGAVPRDAARSQAQAAPQRGSSTGLPVAVRSGGSAVC